MRERLNVCILNEMPLHRTRSAFYLAFFLGLAAPLRSGADPLSQEHSDFFEKNIRPVLVDKCYSCHSLQENKSKGGLLVDSREALLKGGDSGPAIVPGHPEKSLLITAVQYEDENIQMPPKHKLPEEQINHLAKWVLIGAPDPRSIAASKPESRNAPDIGVARKFWSFQAVKNPAVPTVRNERWPLQEVDYFVLAKMEEKGFVPAPPAEKRIWLRRVTFDLTGIPPTEQEMDHFLSDESANAYDRVVDRLLASFSYGERWGRYWLDVVRYADTAGDSSDYPVPQAHKYRDYVVKAFNQDKPFDQFLREQIAGDLLPSASEAEKYEKIIATGYLAMARRFGVNPESVQHLTIEDTIDNLGKAVLGLTVSCARCHDHKYDPISMADYYGLYGIFNSTRYPFAGSENEKRQRNLIPLIAQEEVERLMEPVRKELQPLDEQIESIQAQIAQLRKEQNRPEQEGEDEQQEKEEPGKKTITQLREEVRGLRRKKDEINGKAPDFEKAFAVMEGKPGDVHIQIRGEPGRNGELAARKFLAVLGDHKLPASEKGSGRLQLAQWLTDPTNPLTARVMVNRVWQYHFGKGLVQTPNDFGARGKTPTHPELLDYLAWKFVESGWSIKSLHRMIVLSRTYRQSSANPRDYTTFDPNNEFLWKFNRQRLDAEAIRDSLLFMSGELDHGPQGTHPFPPQEKWTYTQHAPFNAVYESSRRSVYLMQQRIKKHPYLEIFDGADPNASTAERRINITPLQALFLMNDKFAHAQAEGFARRIRQSAADEGTRVQFAHRAAFGRDATQEELVAARQYLAQYRQKLGPGNLGSEQVEQRAYGSFARVLMSSNEFIFID